LVLIRLYGFQGAVIGTSISLGLASALFLVEYQLETKSPLWDLMRTAYFKPIVSALLVFAGLRVIARLVANTWVALFAGALIFGGIYFILLLLLRFFDSVDLSVVERVIRLPSFVRRIVPNAELGRPLLSNRPSAQAPSE